ncbi:DUF4873 domain-containing protein [Actinokineospora diospyrosa]|uniref:DUF4873 domain-containing protein n=1 Tax=Actinokineospora diospyrosa TaxID=103728 RepID=A0ABT1IL72_9PSEU|nr:DUF4873 domain-containing protein [Actinokineospora diospyrosa]MCP2273401.1 protein of unknown function (DUF4873) [Actinokineospora diospyrosa]
MPDPLDEDGYRGPARLHIGPQKFAVTVDLRGHFQPIDGYYRWYGRVSADQLLSEALAGRKTTATLHTPQVTATGELSDPDPWDRYRIMGTSTPPFTVVTELDAALEV